MTRKYKISSLQQTLFGGQAFNYFKTATESKSMSGWDFDGGGDLNDFDLSVYKIALMLYEESEARKDHARLAQEAIDSFTMTVGSKTFKLSDMTPQEIAGFFNNLNKALKRKALKIQAIRQAGFKEGFQNNQKKSKFISVNPKTTLNYRILRVPNLGANINQLKAGLENKKTKVTVASLGITNKTLNSFTNEDSLEQIIQRYIVINGANSKRATQDTFESVLLLNDSDADYFPLFSDTTLTQNVSDVNLYRVGTESRLLYGYDIIDYSTQKNYKENFIFKTTDTKYEQLRDKVIKYASGVYEQQDVYNADPNGPIDDFGVTSYSTELKSLKNIPIPSAHASYRPENIEGTTISSEYKVNSDGLATEFFAAFDISFFRNNIENILKPQIRDALSKLVQKIIDAGAPVGFPFADASNIDFSDKVAADMVSAICDGNKSYFTTSKALGGPYGIEFGGTITEKQFDALATTTAGPRFYSDKQIIERPVWKLIKCHTEETYYVRANEFYDYSMSGLYHLANISSTSDPLPENENLFLNKRYGNGEVAGIYNLLNYTDQYLEADYTTNYFGKGPFTQSWPTIESNAKLYFYNQKKPEIPTGCYKVYLGILPKDKEQILNYTSLPHYYREADCSKPPCVPPPPTPPPTQTPTQTASVTQTPTLTRTNTPTRTQTRTPTRTQTQTASVTKTQTQTRTPTRTQTQTASVTKTQTQTNTPTKTQTQTPSVTRSQTRTPTQTQSPTKTQTPSTTKTLSNTRTPTKTQSPSTTPTKTPTTTPTVTPSATITQTVTPSHTRTPTQTKTSTKTPTVTPSPTKTPTKTKPAGETATPTRTPTVTPSETASSTVTPTATISSTVTPSATETPRRTSSPTKTPTTTLSLTPSPTKSLTATGTQTRTPRPSPSTTKTVSATPTKTRTPTNTRTPQITPTSTTTLTATPTKTQTGSKTPTRTQTRTPTNTRTPTKTQTPSKTQTRTNTPSTTQTRTSTRTATPTRTPSTTRTVTATVTQTASTTASPTVTPSPGQNCEVFYVNVTTPTATPTETKP